MYWGIKHADKSESTSDDEKQEERLYNQSPVDAEEFEGDIRSDTENNGCVQLKKIDETFESSNECNNNGLQSVMDIDSHYATGGETFSGCKIETFALGTQSCTEKDISANNERCKSAATVVVKTEHISDEDETVHTTTKPEDVVIMEFKEKDVFASFEDYEKSRHFDDQGDFEKEECNSSERNAARLPSGKLLSKVSQSECKRVSVSPPLEIFSESQFSSSESSPTEQTVFARSEKQENFHGNGDSSLAAHAENEKPAGQGKESPTYNESWLIGNGSEFGANKELSTPNLLQPENINRVCIPLIHEGRKRPSKKSTPKTSQASDDEKRHNDAATVTSPSVSDANIHVTSTSVIASMAVDSSHSSFDPVIVSVESIVGLQNPTNHKELNDTLTAHQDSTNGIESSYDNNGPLSSNQSEQNCATESDTQVVVVQDRGTQVCSSPHDFIRRSKRTIRQSNATDCCKPLGVKITPRNTVTSRMVNQNQISGSAKQSVGKIFEMNTRKKAKPSAAVVTQNISSLSRLQPIASKGTSEEAAQRRKPSVRSPAVNTIRVPVVNPRKPELTSANIARSRGVQMNTRNYHVPQATASQGRTNIGENRTAMSQQRVILFTAPLITANSNVTSATSKVPLVASPHTNAATAFGSSSFDRKDMASLTRTLVQPISSLQYQHKATNDKTLKQMAQLRNMQDHAARPNPTFATQTRLPNEAPERLKTSDESAFRNRELIRKLLEEHEARRNSTTYSSHSDMQVMVDCLSSELEKERTLRLRLEIELRKVENQLDQERKLNERLAALLMKR
ncbi:hypothetical protein QZH41_001875 [Actinostola sp. cb2023]|nr:hypothetical protein QZH41_001875 [Actinostola sp. cb2023]